MNSSIFRLTLDLHSVQSQYAIPVMVGDTNVTLQISLTDGGVPYIINDGCLAKLSIKRPTGTHLEEFCIIKNNSVIEYPFSKNENTCAVEGIHECDLTLYGKNGERISSPWFTMVVSPKVIGMDDIVLTDSDYTAVDAMIAEEAIRAEAENGRVSAEVERSEAEAERVANEEERKENAMLFNESVEQAVEAKTASKAYAESAKTSETNAKASETNATNASNVATSQAQSAIESASASASSATEAKGYMEVAKGIAADSTNMDARIAKNDKRITNLEQGLADDNFMIDDAVAYAKDVPANALPFAAVNEIGGMTYKDGDTLRSAKVTEVESVGANLFDYESHRKNGNTSVIKVVPNKTLYRNGQLGNSSVWWVYDNADALIGTFQTFNFTTSNPMVLPSNAAYIETSDNIYTLANFYLGYDSDTTYRPYVKHTLPIPAEVRPAHGINNEVYDYLDCEKKQLIKCVEKVTFTGNGWYYVDNAGGKRFYRGIDNAKKSQGGLLSDRYAVSFWDALYVDAESVGVYTVSEFNAILNEKPLTVVYELAEPIATDIADILPVDNLIGVEGGGTITMVNEHEFAVPSEIIYQLKGVSV